MFVSEHDRAAAFAKMALRGKTDKASEPLFDHASRVADRMETYGERAVAYLHDVVEDSDVELSDLNAFFSGDVVADVDTLTRREGETYFAYIDRVRSGSDTARRVKLADIEDHLARSDHIGPSLIRRYVRAAELLNR